MLWFLLVLNCVVLVAIGSVILKRWRLIREPGLLWLGAALVAWPVLVVLLTAVGSILIDLMGRGHTIPLAAYVYPFSAVVDGRMTLGTAQVILRLAHHLVGGVLALIGVSMLFSRGTSPSAGSVAGSRA